MLFHNLFFSVSNISFSVFGFGVVFFLVVVVVVFCFAIGTNLMMDIFTAKSL